MMEILQGISHCDHGLTVAHLEFIQAAVGDREGFFIETLQLPEELASLDCGLIGPAAGDEPVAEDRVFYAVRGERPGPSRMIRHAPQKTRCVTVIAGPETGYSTNVLYTAFGGPLAPKEPWDPSLDEASLAESKAFWAQHALCAEDL